MDRSNLVPPFLIQFFGEGNAIQWDDYIRASPSSPIREVLQPWVKRIEEGVSPFFLPRKCLSTGQTTWYVICTNSHEARSVQESLLAFVGPTYARFNGERAVLDSSDPIDLLCKQVYGAFVFKLPIVKDDDRKKVNELLTKLNDSRERHSIGPVSVVKPIGRLLRDLEMAILARNEDSARAVYTEIRSRGRLSAMNLTFLEVRIFGAFEQWLELIRLPNLNDLLRVPRPKRVSDQIAEAVYQHYLSDFEETRDVSGAIEEFRRNLQHCRDLVKSVEALHSPSAVKFALVASISSDPQQNTQVKKIVQHKALVNEKEWVDLLLGSLQDNENTGDGNSGGLTTGPDTAARKYEEKDYDRAFELYLTEPHSFLSVKRTLQIAVEIDSPIAAKNALAYLSSASEGLRSEVQQSRGLSSYIDLLRQTNQIKSFQEWFEYVDVGDDGSNARELLENGINDWLIDSEFDPVFVKTKLIQNRQGICKEVVRNAVPVFIDALIRDGKGVRNYKCIYISIIELLIYDESIGSDDLVVIEKLVEAVFSAGPSKDSGANEYELIVEYITYLWNACAAPKHVDWVLSVLDLLIDNGVEQHVSLSPIVTGIVEKSRQWARRVTRDQWAMLELLAGDVGLTELVADVLPNPVESTDENEAENRFVLANKSIAVYSLTERIGRRFGQLARQMFGDISIHYLNDKVLSDRMKNLARSADVFIVNTWDAKHAATNGIKQYRSSDQVILEPDSKSSTSLLRCLINYVEQSCEKTAV
jgi:hypothetical protein